MVPWGTGNPISSGYLNALAFLTEKPPPLSVSVGGGSMSHAPFPACGLLTVGSGCLCYRTGCRKKSSSHSYSTFSFSAAVLLLFFLFVRNHLVTACTKCSIQFWICHLVYRPLLYSHFITPLQKEKTMNSFIDETGTVRLFRRS